MARQGFQRLDRSPRILAEILFVRGGDTVWHVVVYRAQVTET